MTVRRRVAGGRREVSEEESRGDGVVFTGLAKKQRGIFFFVLLFGFIFFLFFCFSSFLSFLFLILVRLSLLTSWPPFTQFG